MKGMRRGEGKEGNEVVEEGGNEGRKEDRGKRKEERLKEGRKRNG